MVLGKAMIFIKPMDFFSSPRVLVFVVSVSMLVLSSWGSYDVHLSVCEQDCGKNFCDHLHKALIKAGFLTFRDKRGEKTDIEIEMAIKESRIAAIVFSKDYASSAPCLDNLVLLMNAARSAGIAVVPIFYKVHPSETMYREAIVEHKKNFHSNIEIMRAQRWSAAINESIDLKGMVPKHSYEADFIKDIVKRIQHELFIPPLLPYPPSSSCYSYCYADCVDQKD